MATQTLAGQVFDRTAFDTVIRRRLFFTKSFEIYRTAGLLGDNRGLYEYGPSGCSLRANIVDLWRKHFVLEEEMLELHCTVLTPEKCSRPADTSTNGSASKNNTLKPLDDAVIKEYKSILAQIDNYDGDDLGALIKRLDIRSPDGNNEVLPPVPFNLMFKSSIGPSAAAPVYLRPETAQGQFLNFRKLLEYNNNNSMPFASASVGRSYRNEISPRSGLLRVREFLMVEIEHFVDPRGGKKHDRFDEFASVELPPLDRNT